MILMGGIASLMTLPKQSFPDVELNMTSLFIEYDGASPADVDEQINEKVEKAIDGVAGVKKITTAASQ